MTTHVAPHYPSSSSLAGWLTVGFIAGFLAVLVFHQGAVAALHAAGITPRAAFPTQPTSPFGVPQIWSLAFWGGIWGIVLAASLARLEGTKLVLAALVFGAILPTLVAWFVVAPLKGLPIAGFAPKGMSVGLIANGAWGLGTGLALALFGRSRRQRIGRGGEI
jgi:hypothetical protein